MFCKKGVLKNFANFTGKHLSWSLFLITFQVFRPATLLKIDSNTNVSKNLRTPILKNISTERKVFFKRNNFIQSNISINILLKILTLHAF